MPTIFYAAPLTLKQAYEMHVILIILRPELRSPPGMTEPTFPVQRDHHPFPPFPPLLLPINPIIIMSIASSTADRHHR